MSIVISEANQSPLIEQDPQGFYKITRNFIITGTNTASDLKTVGPQRREQYSGFPGVVVDSRRISPQKLDSNDPTLSIWSLQVIYVDLASKNSGALPPRDEPEYELSIMTQTEHIDRAISQQNYPSASATEVGDIIGLTDEGDIDGVDIFTPKPKYTEVKSRTSLSTNYKRVLNEAVGKVNDAPWKDWFAGEVLFLGAVARRKGTDPWRISYEFAISFDYTFSVSLSDGSTPEVTKGGWQYFWSRFVQVSNEAETEVNRQRKSIHLATVYQSYDFAKLGLGG